MAKDIKIQKYERVLGRQLSDHEAERLNQMKNVFEIHDNDALWDMILIMEYYTTLCTNVPQQIDTMLSCLPDYQKKKEKALGIKKKIELPQNILLYVYVLCALACFALGYILPHNGAQAGGHTEGMYAIILQNMDLVSRIFLTTFSWIACGYFTMKYIKHGVLADKKWFVNLILAFLFLVSGLCVLLVV